MAEERAPVQNIAAWRVTLDGQDLAERLAPRLVSLSLTEKRGGEADQLDITLHDHDGLLDIPQEGATLHVSIGWKQGRDVRVGMVEKGSFKVDDVEWSGPPDIITIRARSADLTDAYRVRREQSRRDTTIGEVIGGIAQANGLRPRVAPQLASVQLPVLAQDQRSDMALVKALGRRFDAVATVKGGALIFMPIGQGTNAAGAPLPTFAITRRDGDAYRYARAKREQYDGVEARWHDQERAERRTVRAGGPASGAGTSAGGGAAAGRPKRLQRTFHTEVEASAAASAEDRRIRRAEAEFEFTCALGNPALEPEQRGRLSGFKPEIDGREWLIAEATHALDATGGLTTKLKLEVAI